jgi:FkbM family methyltransferase
MWHLQSARGRIRGGELVVRFDNLDADIRLDGRSDLALRALGCGEYEPDLLAVLPALTGDGDVINVGANVGIVAIAVQRCMAPGNRLLCVEPIEECVDRLTNNLFGAGIHDAIVLRAFATAEANHAHAMWTVPGKPEYSSGSRIVHPSVRDDEQVRLSVPAVRLDDAVIDYGLRPSLIVMDCEGGEAHVLHGARQVLGQFQPIVVMEFDPILLSANETPAADVLVFLQQFGYQCMTLASPPTAASTTESGTVIAIPAVAAERVVGEVARILRSLNG